jgi:hypothetical protein
MCKKLTYLALALVFGLATSVPAAKIIWVSDNKNPTNNIPADQGWVDLLSAQGHTVDYTNVTVNTGYWNNIDTDSAKLAALNAADLIIVSRDLNSGSYANNATEITRWNTDIKKPVMLMVAHVARNTDRWRWVQGTQADATPTLQAVNTTHPIFNGVTLNANNQVSILTGICSISNATSAGNGILIATRADNSNVWIVEWPKGTEYYSGSGYTAGARRMLFCGGGTAASGPDGSNNFNNEGQTMFLNAVNYLINFKQLKAYSPNPSNGAQNVRPTSLTWSAGDTAAAHDVYFGYDATAVTNATTSSTEYRDQKGTGDTSYIPGALLLPATTHYWRIDEIEEGGTAQKGDVWSFTTPGLKAYNPSPANGSKYVDPNADLSWSAGFKAKTLSAHDVYLGTDATAVANADTSSPEFKINRSSSSWDPGTLANDTTYYWRIDEHNTDNSVTKGDVWSFKVIPVITITDPNLVGWWKLDEVQGTKAIDWSGHAKDGTLQGSAQWVTGYDGNGVSLATVNDYVELPTGLVTTARGAVCVWIKTTQTGTGMIFYGSDGTSGDGFGTQNELHLNMNNVGGTAGNAEFWLTGSPSVQFNIGRAVNDNTWHHFAATWDTTGGIQLYLDGTMMASATNTGTNFNLSGRIRLGRPNDATRNYTGSLDDVRLYNKALTANDIKQVMRIDVKLAWNPSPAHGSILPLGTSASLSWSKGDFASIHDVYFGTDQTTVEDATTSTAGIYKGRQVAANYTPPGTLKPLQTYYWRIDEYNTDTTISKGRVWRFSIANYIIVDNFEDYNDSYPRRIWENWIDGWGTLDPPPGIPGNGTASTVGYATSPFAEQTYVHSGKQAMPMDYDNTRTPYYSETDRTFATPQNWTSNGVKALSLWFRGWPASTGSFTEAPAGTYTITATGTDIWDVTRPRETWFHDEFHYAYQTVSGATITAIARVESIVNTNVWAKAGVMLRDSLDANSPHVSIYMTPGSGTSLQYRTTAGAASSSTTTAGITTPRYVKLEVDTAGARGYYSDDGITWIQVGTQQTIYMTAPMYIGLAVTSHNAAATTTAKFTNVSITGGAGVWGHQDIGIKSNIAGPLYVALQDSTLSKTAVITHPDPNAALNGTYQEWNIPLSSFTGINPAAIKKIIIGVGNRSSPTPGGAGTIYIDDIRVYRPRCFPGLIKPPADFDNSCVVDYPDIGILTDNWLIQDYQVTPVTPSDANLEAWYRFENNAQDSSGKNRHGDPCNTPTYTTGKVGTAINLNGTNQSVDSHRTPSQIGLGGSAPKTVCAWVYTRAFNNGGIFDMGDNVNAQNYSLRTMADPNMWRAQRYGYPTYDFDFEYPSVNAWVHMALVYDGVNQSWAYADGILVGSQTATLNTANTRTFGIGLWSGNYFNGLIDEVRVYSRALTQGEVASLAGKTTPFTQTLYRLLTPQDPAINMYNDGVIDLKDYALVADTWLDELLWPQ